MNFDLQLVLLPSHIACVFSELRYGPDTLLNFSIVCTDFSNENLSPLFLSCLLMAVFIAWSVVPTIRHKLRAVVVSLGYGLFCCCLFTCLCIYLLCPCMPWNGRLISLGGRGGDSNSKILILKDSSVRSIWTYLTASPCYTTNSNKHNNTANRYYKLHRVPTNVQKHRRERQTDRQTDRQTGTDKETETDRINAVGLHYLSFMFILPLAVVPICCVNRGRIHILYS